MSVKQKKKPSLAEIQVQDDYAEPFIKRVKAECEKESNALV